MSLLRGDVMTRRILGWVQVILGISVLTYMLIYGMTEAAVTFAVFLALAGVIFQFASFHHDRQASRRSVGK
jgi:Flp pilus assembly protein protease CpaA